MAISGVNPKCYILALFVRDDGARFLLGDDPFEFKDNQLHFQQNTMANDVVEVQGNDGYLLAGQVRRPGTQMFDGYVCNGTNSKEDVEAKRRSFLQFFRRSHFYKVIYVFPNGTAIQRKQGFLVDDPTVQELYQQYPAYHVALNFEDVNYYTYEEDDQGHEIYAKEAIVPLAGGGATGGLIWDNYGVVWEDPWSLPLSISGVQFQILNDAGARAPIENVELYGNTYQQTYSGANLFDVSDTTGQSVSPEITVDSDGWISATYNNTSSSTVFLNYRTNPMTLNASTSYAIFTEVKSISGTGSLVPVNNGSIDQFVNIVNYSFSDLSSGGIYKATDTAKSDFTSVTRALGSYIRFGAGQSGSVTFRISVIADTSVTPQTFVYQPYTGGIPAPNPDYPQDVQTVTGEQTVEVTGKNLIDSTNLSFVYSNSPTQIELSSISNGIRMVNNGGVSQDRFAVFRSVDMTPYIGKVVRMKATFGTGGGIRLYRIASDGSNRSQMATTTVSDTEISFTVPADLGASPYLGYVLDVTVGGGTTVDFTNLIATVDSSIEPYEPYQGQSYPISLTGKNLWSSTLVIGGISSTGASLARGDRVNSATKVLVQPNTTYTLSAVPKVNGKYINVAIQGWKADGSFISQITGSSWVNVPVTFTTPANCYKISLNGRYSDDTVFGTVGSHSDAFQEIQLELGSTATPYTPYSPIELCKLGTYQDYIYKSGDDWYVHKALSKYTFTGSETFNYQGTYKGFTISSSNLATYMPGIQTPLNGCSDHFIVETSTTTWTGEGKIGLSASGTFWAKSTAFGGTQQTCETWLSTNTPTVYYALATPTDTKITDATLVGQLDALGAMKLFIGENNVLVSAPTPNLPATLAFDYYTKFTTLGAEWEEGGTKGATIVNVDAIDNTYPVWELTGPATNPTLSVLTTNTALTYNGTITASQKLVIDMFNKTATLNGTSVIGNISGDFVYMAPGTNRLAYTAGNTDAPDSTIYWQEVVG